MHRLGTILGILACLRVAGMAAPPHAAECVTDAPFPAEIGAEESQRLYNCLAAEMRATFKGVEGVPGIPDYSGWPIASTNPFISLTHGRMFINHIIDPEAEAIYREWEGIAGGPGSAAMRFCHHCHGAVMHQDAMFFPPRAYRAE